MKNLRSVALLIETSNAYPQGLLEDIVASNREHKPPTSIHNWKGSA